MLLTVLMVHTQKQLITGQKLKDVLTSEPFLKSTFRNIFGGVDLTNNAASELSNRISSSHWSIRVASHHCLLIRHGSNYKVSLEGALLCLKRYYQFCMQRNAVPHIPELTSQYASVCTQFRFSEPSPSRNARIWDIRVPLGFHINLTVTDLQITYHPGAQCHDSQVNNGLYTGQGLAIDNYTTVCQRIKHHSYLLPMSKARIILNYTRIPDRPVLEFMYEAIIPQQTMDSYVTLLKLNFFHVLYLDLLQSTKRRLIIYVKTYVRFAVSLLNVTLRCESNFNRGNQLDFIDGPIFLVSSYLKSYALIASLDCNKLAASASNASLKNNNGRYRHMDQVKASIGDLTVVLKGSDKDISMVDFTFVHHLPDTPYGHFSIKDYTATMPGVTSKSLLTNLNLPVQGRHFHILYSLQRSNLEFQYVPRLVFHINRFQMVSFRDGCHTGGIFISEGFTTIASYCSQAGISFLNSTSEIGILFGATPLVLILKGYSWFANIRLKISIIYDNCAGVTNICDKFRDNWSMFPNKCSLSDGVPCRYVTPTPCIEIMRLPSDGLLD